MISGRQLQRYTALRNFMHRSLPPGFDVRLERAAATDEVEVWVTSKTTGCVAKTVISNERLLYREQIAEALWGALREALLALGWVEFPIPETVVLGEN